MKGRKKMVRFTADQIKSIGDWADDNFTPDTPMVLHPDYITVIIDGEEHLYGTPSIYDQY